LGVVVKKGDHCSRGARDSGIASSA
jgi:hypothetical protein